MDQVKLRRLSIPAVAALAFILLCGYSAAEDLTIALRANATSVDPHFHHGPNAAMAEHIFDALVAQDERQQLTPGLAESWRPINDTTWEFKLRSGVKFHDGSSFDADDVLCSYERAPNVLNSPGSFATFVKGKTLKKVNDLTVHISTEGPYPQMANDTAMIYIVSSEKGCGATTGEFHNGKAAVGTGPYKLVKFIPDERIELTRNDNYWGDKPEFENVTFKPIKSNPSRVAALLAGDVDMISQVPTTDLEKLEADPNVSVWRSETNRLIFLFPDHWRKYSPFVHDKEGGRIENPLRDNRVRLALSKAINREAIRDRVMEGQSVPAGQYIPDGFFGASANLTPEAYDPAGAKALLAEAGHGDGFKLRLHGPNDRYINDSKILEAMAQMFSRIGIVTDIETMPRSVYFDRASRGADGKPEFSAFLVGWGTRSGEASMPLRALVHSYDKEAGFGANNRGRYNNPKVDKLIEEAQRTVDDAERASKFSEIAEIAIKDHSLIPIHFQMQAWATRKGLKYAARTDEFTFAFTVTKE